MCVNSSCVRSHTKYTLHLRLTSLSTTRCILLEIVFPVLLSFDLVNGLSCFINKCAVVIPGCLAVILKM